MKSSLLRKTLFILIIFFIVSNSICKSSKNKKSKKKDTKKSQNKPKEKVDLINSLLKWAEKNNIYINKNLKLNEKSSGHKFYFFSAESKIPSNTLLLRVPYSMLLTTSSFDTFFKSTKNKKFQNLWEKIFSLKNEHLRFFSTKQLFYLSIIIHNMIKKRKGVLYNKYKEYLNLYDDIDLDTYPVFYEEQEKYYLSGSSFGSQISRADRSLNEEYYLLNNVLNISAPFQDEFLKYRVLTLANSIDFNNSNFNYSNNFNETVVIPFIDCFNKVVSTEKSNAKFIFNGIKNEETNYTDYYLEVYSDNELILGSEIDLKWRVFPNTECLLYYGFVEEGNPLKPRYYIDLINRKFKEDLGIDEKTEIENAKRGEFDSYEINSEFYSPSVINAYRNITKEIEKYNKTYSGKEEGPYQMMLDNLKYYLDLYNKPLTDGNINQYITRKENIENIKQIMHMEKAMVQEKVDHLEKVVAGIKLRNQVKNEHKKDKKTEDKNGNKEDL